MYLANNIRITLNRYWYLIALLIISLLSYCGTLISPAIFWPAIFFCYLIPICIIFNGISIIVHVYRNKWIIILPVIGVLGGCPFLFVTLNINKSENETKSTNQISITGFNAKLFRKSNTYNKFSVEMIDWLVADSSDIKCVQEYNTNPKWPELDVSSKILKSGYQSFEFKSDLLDNERNPGLAIFSRFDLINSGVVFSEKSTINGAIFVDLKVKNETLRIYNVHLASMYIDFNALWSLNNPLSNLRHLIYNVRSGTIKRTNQIDLLIKHAKSSPYSFIICGDFNETPYSYNYWTLKSEFLNAFDEVGNGFGFTLNAKPFLLRIDHQFYDRTIKALQYKVNTHMNISDHFPTSGLYSLN